MADCHDPERDLEEGLRVLGRRLDVPPAPPAARIAAAVRARLESPPAPHRPVVRYAVALLALLVGGALVAVPDVRAAIAELFRIGGVVVEQRPGPPPAAPPSPLAPLERRVADLAEAERLTGFRAAVPAELGPPDEVLVTERRVISLVYRATAGRPAIRLDQFGGEVNPAFAKFLFVGEPHSVDIDGTVGWWVGEPHEIVYVDASGRRHRESARLAAATLIWQHDRTTFRLEGDLDAERAVAIAESTLR